MMFKRLTPLFALALVAAACGAPPEAAPADSQIIVEMTDFKLTANLPTVKAGTYKIGVRNLANMEHSFQVLKTDLPHDKLPIEGGAKAREDGKVGEIKSLAAGKSGAVTVDLTPGRYVLICNTAGHYQLGMHVGFIVEAP
jgi:uncharacterized cupredoxin-like copper-binding protein